MVKNILGYGYKEKSYEKVAANIFVREKINFKRQCPYKLMAGTELIEICYLDFLIENKIILELKKGDYFSRHNIKQVKCYLKVTSLKLAILANFTSSGVKFMRILNLY